MAFSDNHAFDSELNNPSVALLGGSTAQSYQSLGLKSLPAQGEAEATEPTGSIEDFSGNSADLKQESAAFIEKLLSDSRSAFDSSSDFDIDNEGIDTGSTFEFISSASEAPALLEKTLVSQQPGESSQLSTEQPSTEVLVNESDSIGAEALTQQIPVDLPIESFSEPVEFLGTVFGSEPQPIGSLPLSLVKPLLASVREDALGLLA